MRELERERVCVFVHVCVIFAVVDSILSLVGGREREWKNFRHFFFFS